MNNPITQAIEALEDITAGWKYIRSMHGDLYGVGWDRAQGKAEAALASLRAAQEGDLPPLLTDERIEDVYRDVWSTVVHSKRLIAFARAIESEVRLALAAAGGGVPKANSIQRRAASLHSKTGMSWDEAEQLALSEAGIDDEAIDELIGECGYSGLESLLTTPDELRRFTRSVLVHQPLASSTQPEAARTPVRVGPSVSGMLATRSQSTAMAVRAVSSTPSNFKKQWRLSMQPTSDKQAAPAVAQGSPNNDVDLLLRQVFALCEATEDAPEVEPKNEHQRGFDKGRRFEAKQIRRAIGDWFQAEFCGRSFMGEPVVAATEAPAQRCPYCDDTGDVHTPTGEWRGRCTCPAGTEAPAQAAQSAGEVERDRKDAERRRLFVSKMRPEEAAEANKLADAAIAALSHKEQECTCLSTGPDYCLRHAS